ncbi:MAG: 30S ribosomal protein S3 [Francisellaceae bacterium]|jgi:small subunit ribosomal protein S3|nr:30S ribosomal protein S3 [Francisellaceae bacterium]MBT6539123.1 30S ribosomal protein S3 [Francisellaceae bacterium]
MGQKVHPIGIRLGYIRESNARWFPNSQQNYADILRNDIEIREYLNKSLPSTAAVSGILIERAGTNVKALIRTAKPGVVIGKKGEDIEKIRKAICDKHNINLQINIEEIRKPELEAPLVAAAVAAQLEKRIMFRRAMKRAVTSTMRQGALGIRIAVAGRLGGAEIARTEWYREGRVPLHTFRANIDYALAEAKTTYGIIGVKVWIYKGDILDLKKNEDVLSTEASV